MNKSQDVPQLSQPPFERQRIIVGAISLLASETWPLGTGSLWPPDGLWGSIVS